MSLISTVISDGVGLDSAGRALANKPEDVRKVQGLLGKVLGPAAPLFRSGVCEVQFNLALADFQRAWGSSGGAVFPHDETMKRLDRLACPLKLVIAPSRVHSRWQHGKMACYGGGYQVCLDTGDGGSLPGASSGYTVHLIVGENAANAIDVTKEPHRDLMGIAKLRELLALLEKLAVWATPVCCRLQLRYKNAVISTSMETQILHAPVRPHNGRLLPLDEVTNGPKLTYQGEAASKESHGRMLIHVPGYANELFVYGGHLETRNEFRGFDCITYVGTACGASNAHMAASDDLADSLLASPVSLQSKRRDAKSGQQSSITVELENAEPADVKAWFAAKPSGYFLMWSGGHVVLVANGEVHEFKASAPSGYTRTPVAAWLAPYTAKRLTVRQLPGKPARAS